jgi:hypothetical protein
MELEPTISASEGISSLTTRGQCDRPLYEYWKYTDEDMW